MSISDELMWKYFLLLTDLRGSEVEALQANVAAGHAHPMEVKKRLARTIVSGFHGEAAAASADEDWARMFQQKGESGILDEVTVAFSDVSAPPDGTGQLRVRLPHLLVRMGLARSTAEAHRKLEENAVRFEGNVTRKTVVEIGKLPARLVVRLGKQAKIVEIA